jgi:probable phosphoglycerate mutase
VGADHRRLFGALANCAWSELVRRGEGWRLIRHNTWAASVPGRAAHPADGSVVRELPELRRGPSTTTTGEATADDHGDADAVV